MTGSETDKTGIKSAKSAIEGISDARGVISSSKPWYNNHILREQSGATSLLSKFGTDAPVRNILVLDRCSIHREGIDRAILDCGAKALWIQEVPDGNVLSSCRNVLLVELDSRLASPSTVFAGINTLRQKGFTVLAFTDGIASWPVRDRCLALLAGASHLLDSQQEGFAEELRHLLTELLAAEAGQEAEDRRIRDTMAGLGVVGVSPAIITVFRKILRLSVLSDLPTLLTGETGTGKELLARAIHALDPKRCKGPFIALNCAALTPTLAESELFGHRRGAFTGAERDRRGLIRAAQGGVLLLDEIGELDVPLQAKLLRVLQENRVLSIGDEQETAISVRVVAATNRDLRELVKEGRFRSDLFHRLTVTSVHIPALRERPEDIGPLTRLFVAKFAGLRRECGLKVAVDFIEALTQAELPGNVRQLENLVRQALINKKGSNSSLSLSDLPAEIWQQLCGQKAGSAPTFEQSRVATAIQSLTELRSGSRPPWEELLEAHGGSLARCLEWCERALLTTALRCTQGNQSETARLLGITPRSVYNKVHKHQLQVQTS